MIMLPIFRPVLMLYVIVSSFAEYHKLDPIQTKLKNTLTDRVAVNHCVVQSL